MAILFATNVLVSAVSALGIKAPQWLSFTVSLLIPLVLLIVVLRRAKSGKTIVRRMGDERINLIYAKSARNALFTTYLAFFVHILTTDANALDTRWVVITLGSGLIVLLASIYFYYFRKA